MTPAGEARGRAQARAALLGNPSDGFGGKTIAFALAEFGAEVAVAEADQVVIEAEGERLRFANAAELPAAGHDRYPRSGPAGLLAAAARRFVQRLAAAGVRPDGIRFAIRLERSTTPPRVGLAGSSAVVIAALRALARHFDAPIRVQELPGLALACERDELEIKGGLQDQVVQSLGGLVYMDFDPRLVTAARTGRHERLDPSLLPPLVVAYRADAGTDSGATHAPVRERFEAGDLAVVETMVEIASLAAQGWEALLSRDHRRLAALIDRNIELRARVYDLDPRHVEMIETARGVGASANYAGSGGAIVALPGGGQTPQALASALDGAGYQAFTPTVA